MDGHNQVEEEVSLPSNAEPRSSTPDQAAAGSAPEAMPGAEVAPVGEPTQTGEPAGATGGQESPSGAEDAEGDGSQEAERHSAIDAAAKVLAEAGEPMDCQTMIKTMAEKGYWTSPGGKTPAATLYSAILRELQTKGNDSRFKKTERGKFGVGRAS